MMSIFFFNFPFSGTWNLHATLCFRFNAVSFHYTHHTYFPLVSVGDAFEARIYYSAHSFGVYISLINRLNCHKTDLKT